MALRFLERSMTWVQVGIGYEMTLVRVGKVCVDLGTTLSAPLF